MNKKKRTRIKLVLVGNRNMTDLQIDQFGEAIKEIQKILNKRQLDEKKI